MPSTYDKDPDAELDYQVDWSRWLPAGDTIATSAWLVPEGITHLQAKDARTDTTATLWLAGGEAGEEYLVTNRVTTTGGRRNDSTIKVRVQHQ